VAGQQCADLVHHTLNSEPVSCASGRQPLGRAWEPSDASCSAARREPITGEAVRRLVA